MLGAASEDQPERLPMMHHTITPYRADALDRLGAPATGTRWLAAALVGWAAFAAMAVVVLGQSAALTGLDHAVLAVSVAHRTSALDLAATLVTALGSFPVVAVTAATVAGVLIWRTRSLLLPLTLLVTVVMTSSVVLLAKEVIGRDRPPIASMVGPAVYDPSFPSGHTTSGSVVWVLGAVLLASTMSRRWTRRLVTACGIVLAVVIGLTRAYLGYHWISDVVGGWLLATAIGATALFLAVRLRPHTDRLTFIRDVLPPIDLTGQRPVDRRSPRALRTPGSTGS